MDAYPAAPPPPPEPAMRHRLGDGARRVDWVVTVVCALVAVGIVVAATFMIGLVTSTCSETGDCNEAARDAAFLINPLAAMVCFGAAVVAIPMLHRRGRQAWWTGLIALVLTTVSAIAAVVIGSGAPH